MSASQEGTHYQIRVVVHEVTNKLAAGNSSRSSEMVRTSAEVLDLTLKDGTLEGAARKVNGAVRLMLDGAELLEEKRPPKAGR